MLTIESLEELREQLQDWRTGGDHIAFVPTMGNLHEGHLSLVRLARAHGERVVVSIFVNPTQFAAGEDFAVYPRTLERDKRRLSRAKADVLFCPSAEEVYPYGTAQATIVHVPEIGSEFCGSARPGHFDGVTSVVMRLFAMVQPDAAVFGQKDYQQQLIIKRMVSDLNLPIQVATGPTQREEDGLAMSSRNQYLSEEERSLAPQLHQALEAIAERLHTGDRNYSQLEDAAVTRLKDAGFTPDYVGIRRAENLAAPDRDDDELVVLAAAQLGKTRLIDNVLVHI